MTRVKMFGSKEAKRKYTKRKVVNVYRVAIYYGTTPSYYWRKVDGVGREEVLKEGVVRMNTKWKYSPYCSDDLTSKDKRRAIGILERNPNRKYEKGDKIWHAEGSGRVLNVLVMIQRKEVGLDVYLDYHVLLDDSKEKRWLDSSKQYESEEEFKAAMSAIKAGAAVN